MFKLNASQSEAVEDASKALLIVAGPGTGKTRVLISKILHEINARKIDAERILCVTFSKRATGEIEDRIAEISPRLAEAIQISTLHSFCVDLCQRHGFRLGLSKKMRLITEGESRNFLREISNDLPLLKLLKTSSVDPLLDDLFDLIAQAKDAGLWPEDILSYAQSLPEDAPERSEWMAIGEIYAVWQSRAFEKGLIDFGDSLLMSERLLSEFRQVRAEEQKAFDLVLVDEFQDTNWAQIKLLKSLCGDMTRIVVVGDDDQSIYRFRGASYSAFNFFLSTFPNARVVELNETYRLAPSIAQAASQLIQANANNRYKPDKKIISKAPYSGELKWIKSPNEKSEASALSKLIEDLIANGENPASIAILARSHRHADLLATELKKRSILFRRQNRSDWKKSPVIRDVLAFFRSIIDPNDRISYLRLLDSPFFRLPAEAIFAAIENSTAQESRTEIPEVDPLLKEMAIAALRENPSELLSTFVTKTKVVPFLLEKNPDELRQLGLFLSALTEIEALSADTELRRLLTAIEDLLENSSPASEESEIDADSAIHILSLHASKGLEFDTVILPSLVSRRFPSLFSKSTWTLPEELNREKPLTKENHLCEERRLFYVGMTRAKKRLILSSYEKRGTKTSLFVTEDLKEFWNQNPGSLIEAPAIPENFEITPQPFERVAKMLPPSSTPSTRALSLSYTQIEKYETCPLSYRFKYDFKIPVKVPVQMALGSAIHEALENFFKEIQMGARPSKENLLHFFEKAFEHEKARNTQLTETHQALGREKIALYFDSYQNIWPEPLDIEKDFVLPLGPHKIRGKIDRIDRVGNRIRIVDYKTGRAKSDAKAEDRKFAEESLQFSIYALAARDIFKWEIESLVFDYIYDCTKLSTQRTDAQLDTVKAHILEMATQIQRRDFPAKPGFHCDWCEYKELCPAALAK